MGSACVVKLKGRCYRCKSCKTHLALADDVVSRFDSGERHTGSFGGEAVSHWVSHCWGCLLLLLPTSRGLEYEVAPEDSQKYREGKIVLERSMIVDEAEFCPESNIDTRPRASTLEEV